MDLKKFVGAGQAAQTAVNKVLSEAEVAMIARENKRSIDKDSIYWSKERYRIIPQHTGPLSIQHLVIDTYENEIVGTHARMADAMAQRERLDP